MTTPGDEIPTKRCTRCGETKPTSEFNRSKANRDGLQAWCRACQREQQREYDRRRRQDPAVREKEREQQREYARRRWQDPVVREQQQRRMQDPANREQRREYDRRRWRRLRQDPANREKSRERVRRWLQDPTNREQKREYDRRWRQDPAVREKKRVHNSRRRAQKRGAPGVPPTAGQLAAKLALYGGLCWICLVRPYECWDHVKPLSKGGPHTLNNLRPACSRCNHSKGAKWPFDPSPHRNTGE